MEPFRSDATAWERGFDAAMVPEGAARAFVPSGGTWDDALRASVNAAGGDDADAGFGWEDQLAVGAEEILKSPTRLTRALGRVLERGYDTERALPIAVELARQHSPFHPPWRGLGRVPDGAQPKRETDWWAAEELDPGIQAKYGRAGTTYADGEPNARPAGEGVRPGDGDRFLARDAHLGGDGWRGADPYRARNAMYANIPDENLWWDDRELDQSVVREVAERTNADKTKNENAPANGETAAGSRGGRGGRGGRGEKLVVASASSDDASRPVAAAPALDDDFAGDGFYARAADGDPPGSGEGTLGGALGGTAPATSGEGEGGTSGGPRANEGEPFAGGGRVARRRRRRRPRGRRRRSTRRLRRRRSRRRRRRGGSVESPRAE